jgi:hypothetical protein
MTAKQILRFALGTLLAILFIWLIARQINLDELKKAFVGITTSGRNTDALPRNWSSNCQAITVQIGWMLWKV